jgi:hypothetical protein
MVVSDLDDDDSDDDDSIALSHQEGEIHATDKDPFCDDSHPKIQILVMRNRVMRNMSVQDIKGGIARRKDPWTLILRTDATCLCTFKEPGHACQSL